MIGMYVFINKGLNMSSGKMSAQAIHAGIEAYRISDKGLIKKWYKHKFYPVYVMEAKNAEHLYDIERYLKEREIKSSMIIDEPMTELDRHSPTALGVELVDKEVHGEVFSMFKLFKETIKINLEFDK